MTLRSERLGLAAKLAAVFLAAGAGPVVAQSGAAQPDPCDEVTGAAPPRLYEATGPNFLCEAEPCYNIRITDIETGETQDVARIFACPADAADRPALESYVALDLPGETIRVVGYTADWDGFGLTGLVLVATAAAPAD